MTPNRKQALETFLATFSSPSHGQPVIGWMSDIENLTRTKAEDFLHLCPQQCHCGDTATSPPIRHALVEILVHPAGHAGGAGSGKSLRRGNAGLR
jgi:hypothetical protein